MIYRTMCTLSLRELQREARRDFRENGPRPSLPVIQRPQTRADCENGPRPCPWVGCKHNLFLEPQRNGGLKFPHGTDAEALLTMRHTCALDVAAKGGIPLEEVGQLMSLTRERVRQVEEAACTALKENGAHLHAGNLQMNEERYSEGPPVASDVLNTLGVEEPAWMTGLHDGMEHHGKLP